MTDGKEDLLNIYRRIFDVWESYAFKTPNMTVLTPFLSLETGKKVLEPVSKLRTQRFGQMFEDFRASLMFSLMKNNEKTNNDGGKIEERVSMLESNEVEQLLERVIEKTKTSKMDRGLDKKEVKK